MEIDENKLYDGGSKVNLFNVIAALFFTIAEETDHQSLLYISLLAAFFALVTGVFYIYRSASKGDIRKYRKYFLGWAFLVFSTLFGAFFVWVSYYELMGFWA